MKFLLFLSFLFFLFFNLEAQSDEELKNIERKIRQDYYDGDLYGVITELNRLNSFGIDNSVISFEKALCYLQLGEERRAIDEFKKSRLQGDTTLFARFYSDIEFKSKTLAEGYVDDTLSLTAEYNYLPTPTHADTLMGMLRPERVCYDVYYYDLSVKIVPEKKWIIGSNYVYFKCLYETNKIQIDLASQFEITKLALDDNSLTYSRDGNAIFISFNKTLYKDSLYCLYIEYNGNPIIAKSPPWNGGFTWSYNKKLKFPHWVGVSCEHLGASSWWPLKDHLSDKPDSMTINLQVPNGYQGISNGTMISTSNAGSGYTNFKWHVSYPINSYNVTAYMGDFVQFSDTMKTETYTYPVDYYVMPHNKKKAIKYYAYTLDMLRIYEELFGPYPYIKDGAGFVEAPFAGMEHQGAIAIGNSYDEFRDYESHSDSFPHLLIHETAHEWWGNTVAFGDMSDAWISETFATYSEALLFEKIFGYSEYIKEISIFGTEIMNIRPLQGHREINECSFISGDIYFKGALMVHNFRCLLDNDSLFFEIIKGFYNTFKYKVIYTEDFYNYIEQTTGKSYKIFFDEYMMDVDPPELSYSFINVDNEFYFTYQWTGVKAGFEMPFCIYLNGKPKRLMGTTNSQTFHLAGKSVFNIPTCYNVNEKSILKNSFTYFWTSRIQPTDYYSTNINNLNSEIGKCLLGKKQGLFIVRNRSGKIIKKLHYLNGLLNGVVITYDSLDRVAEQVEYLNDTLNGATVSYQNDFPKVKGYYKNGNRNGTWEYFNDNGISVVKEIYNDSENHTTSGIIFNNEGKIIGKGRYVNQFQVNETWTYFDSKGNVLESLETLSVCDNPAQFPGGDVEMYKVIKKNMPSINLSESDSVGKNWISIIINPNGTIGEVKPIKYTSLNYAKLLVSQIEKMPRWIPAQHQGNPVNYKVVLMFKLTK
ncbi:MAG: hypothetical protein CVU05_11430 [Bacteroidetes bacterium HGW-Bacteroidetes-21]|nr:MAG: hypothetical protein CVU05_11430 [Bacteroidetes bacterium HGW-Bacteroidetes-21]